MSGAATVAQLIAKLQAMPQDFPVFVLYDGCCLAGPEQVWQSRGGFVVIAERGAAVYSGSARPDGAPGDDGFWNVPE